MKKLFLLTLCLAFAGLSVAQTKSEKRGACMSHLYEADFAALKTGMYWFYDWGTSPGGQGVAGSDNNGIVYYPMTWGANWDSNSIRNYVNAHPNCKYLMTWNEPNFSNQANLTPQQAAAKWPQIKALADELNLKIISPALNYSAGLGGKYQTPKQWFDEFFQLVPISDIDGLAIHCYMGWSDALKGYVNEYIGYYNKPIWLTEFCSWDDRSAWNTASKAEEMKKIQREYLFDTFDFLETNSMVAKYAWFMAKTYDNNDPTPKFPWMQLLADNNGTLTENGKIFNNMSSYDNSYYHNTQDRIQVNHYISQQGIHLQQTFDLDGIVNSYDMAPGDYMEYNVEVPAAGQFNLFVRYSVTEESKLSVQSGSTALAAPVLPALESKHWATKKYTVTLTAGKQKIRLTNTQGANIRLNWFRLSQDANAEQEKIDEELPGGEEEQQPGTLYHLAKDKPVEASSQQAYGNRLAKFAVDGLIDDNRWGTEWEGSNIDNSRWFLVDLGETKTIKRIDIYWEAAYATAYHIEVSDDKQNWTEIYRTTSGTFSNEKLLVNGQGRYVRFQCDQRATQYGVSFFEFAVWDNPEGQGGAVDLASKDNVYLMQTADRYIVQSQQPVQTMRLYNAKGQVVAQSNSPVISHNCLSQGIYFLLAVNNKGEKTTFKVIKK